MSGVNVTNQEVIIPVLDFLCLIRVSVGVYTQLMRFVGLLSSNKCRLARDESG